MILAFAGMARAAPYAALVMDARTGEVLHARNADTPLHPASLTKMMTLYIAFEAIENGEISLDSMVRVSRKAAGEEPSKLGLREGQRIKLRYLIRAAAVRSANDAATAIGEAIEGSEAAFARRMNRTAKALGMTRTNFKNAHGLTQSGHVSTARDMSILGRHLFYDYPEYYNLFSRKSADVGGGKTVYHTNRRFLSDYAGADGIKTGYTSAAGFNLTASAQRGGKHIIATVFGGRSTTWRNDRMAELMNMGFSRAKSGTREIKPQPPQYQGQDPLLMAAKTLRVVRAPTTSLRPRLRPAGTPVAPAEGPALIAQAGAALVEAAETPLEGTPPAAAAVNLPTAPNPAIAEALAQIEEGIIEQGSAPEPEAVEAEVVVAAATVPTGPVQNPLEPRARPANLLTQFPKALPPLANGKQPEPERHVVTRSAGGGEPLWGVNIGRYSSQGNAEKMLLTTALAEIETLEGAERRVHRGATGFDAQFSGLTRDAADRTCQRLMARNQTCFMIGPGT